MLDIAALRGGEDIIKQSFLDYEPVSQSHTPQLVLIPCYSLKQTVAIRRKSSSWSGKGMPDMFRASGKKLEVSSPAISTLLPRDSQNGSGPNPRKLRQASTSLKCGAGD